ncbi:MAG: trypsin-like peptidase domain-containing protein [Planctomycetes bacterium]|nr:trypsin-like peptidase domain-containing protein [Planctomycetota bacterium]
MINNEQRRQIEQFVRQSTVPLFIITKTPKGAKKNIGCGSFFRVGGVLYVVSAKHLLEAASAATEVAVPSETFNGQLRLLPIGDVHAHPEHDVAVMPVTDPSLVEELLAGWQVLEPSNLGRDSGGERELFMLFGFPSELIEDGRDRYTTNPPALLLSRYRGKVDKPFNKSVDIVLGYAKEVRSREGPLPAPELPGVSGSPVWVGVNATNVPIWTPASQLRLVAVEIGWKPGTYIRAVRWAKVAEVFGSFDRGSQREIEAALEKHHR